MNYYLMTSLPLLGEPGAEPPLPLAELRARTAGSDAASLVDVILLSDDLRHRLALLAGEPVDAEAMVLTAEQVKGAEPLPAPLRLEEENAPPPPTADAVWEAYWRYAAAVARRRRSRFVGAWVRFEVTLRNRVATQRARALGRPRPPEAVVPELIGTDPLVNRAVAAWAAAANPLSGWRSLMGARWDWVKREEPRFSFNQDEVAAYAVRLLLLRDWRRTMGVAA